MKVEKLYQIFLESTGVTTDSRSVGQGNLFFALKGDNFDGNDYIQKAIEAGASYAVADRPGIKGEKVILVPDVLTSLQQLARHHREQLAIPVFALTGTNGKTTTKELITSVLSKKYKVTSTTGNLNNHIGVPLTLLKLTKESQLAVVEMGASAPGEIKTLCDIALPDIGLITNIGKAHLLGFGSLDGVKKTKGELYDSLKKRDGMALYNIDNQILCEMVAKRKSLRNNPYGLHHSGAIIMPVTPENPYLRIALKEGVLINTLLIGSYNADNVMAALAAGEQLGVARDAAIEAIEHYTPANNRSMLLKGKANILIVDAYNANPTSMRAALENFSSMQVSMKSLIMGDMLELGADSQQEHREILSYAKEIDAQNYFFVGKEFHSAAADDLFYKENGKFFDTSADLRDYLTANPIKDNSILIKGSRGTKLEKVLEILA